MNEKEILKEAGRDYKPLSDKVKLAIDQLNSDETLLTVTFKVSVTAKVADLSQMSRIDHSTYFALHVKHLLSEIEKNLYSVLPSLNVKLPASSLEHNTKIHIDSHIPDGMILMSPETYTECQRKTPGFMHLLRE